MNSLYKLKSNPICYRENVVQGNTYRFTILTDRLIRMEYCEDSKFEDHATQTVLNRDFPPTKFHVIECEEHLEIYTTYMHITYNKKPFSPDGLSIKIRGYKSAQCGETWRYGDDFGNLGGTARTLDKVNGECTLCTGLMSIKGGALLDDSTSLVFDEQGCVKPRKHSGQDLYFFAYGHDFKDCLNDYYHLCGKTPLLPRYALGNWWSRYYPYTEESYMQLMERFRKEEIPLTVAVLDMDWHLVDIDKKYGNGWTGYTWNPIFFPNPERFLNWLHERGIRVTLNVHPADGVRAYEAIYPKMANAMGIDPSTEQPVDFDMTNPQFLDAYFSVLSRSLEKQGVDFWWIDWQQGANSKIAGLDPLWLLNHFHYLDNGHNGKRPMILSRYAGPGSHRYPLGFSGDTYITWESLEFQPYFTSTASNIGYGWWSHDIGGHMLGKKDDELTVRWLQFGVFSPIMRLHSSANVFTYKEPWKYRTEICEVMKRFLRLRHQLLPYLYTMNHRAYEQNIPLILPMYYETPEELPSYQAKNQYWFGSELMVAPITSKMLTDIHRAEVTVWLPEGIYFDVFHGTTYQGNRTIRMYRDLNSIPVLAKAGSILPMTEEKADISADQNPDRLLLHVYCGADGHFTLYEDDNCSNAYEQGVCAKTTYDWNWTKEKQSFVIYPVEGIRSLIPAKRSYCLKFFGCAKPAFSSVAIESISEKGSEILSANISYDALMKCITIEVPFIETDSEIRIIFSGETDEQKLCLAENPIREIIFAFLENAEIDYAVKDNIYKLICRNEKRLSVIAELSSMKLDDALFGTLLEILTAY